jgi:hypothetical protein
LYRLRHVFLATGVTLDEPLIARSICAGDKAWTAESVKIADSNRKAAARATRIGILHLKIEGRILTPLVGKYQLERTQRCIFQSSVL